MRAPKRPANLALNSDLVAKARAENLNLSAIAEDAIAKALARRARERWDAEIAEACMAHDRYLEKHGSLGELLQAQVRTAVPSSPRRFDIVRHTCWSSSTMTSHPQPASSPRSRRPSGAITTPSLRQSSWTEPNSGHGSSTWRRHAAPR